MPAGMIFQAHIPVYPLNKFIDVFIYFERAEHSHTVDRFLPNGDTEILIDFSDTPQFIYDNDSLKEIQACHHVWASGVRICLLYTSDAADERSSVDLGG